MSYAKPNVCESRRLLAKKYRSYLAELIADDQESILFNFPDVTKRRVQIKTLSNTLIEIVWHIDTSNQSRWVKKTTVMRRNSKLPWTRRRRLFNLSDLSNDVEMFTQ